jgi:hypothetical protein
MMDIIKTSSTGHFIPSDIWQISRRFMNFLSSDPIPGISLVPGQVINYMGQIHDFLFLAWSVPLELSTKTAGYSSNESDWTFNTPEWKISKDIDDLTSYNL